MENKTLDGKVALVTGGSKGLGQEISFVLASAGATVIVNYNKSQSDAERITARIKASGGKAVAIKADVSREADISSLYSEIKEQVGSVDILVNNAGINPSKPLLELTLEDFQKSINVNLTAAFLTTQAALPAMIEKNYGRIINISSVAAQLGGVIGPAYAASKAGMLGLTHSYAALLAKYGGITSNAIAPALIETEMIKKQSQYKTNAHSTWTFWAASRSCQRCAYVGNKWLPQWTNYQCKWWLVHELILNLNACSLSTKQPLANLLLTKKLKGETVYFLLYFIFAPTGKSGNKHA
ncbi:SDR family NAD(P)-dependent oxidoreductase [Niastella soli]|nr:SDR family NAD(P)-dependent oxidoreductase [Niastella soli]